MTDDTAVLEPAGSSVQLDDEAVPETPEVNLSEVMDARGERRHQRTSLRSIIGGTIWNPNKDTGGEPVLPLLLLFGLAFFVELDMSAQSILIPEIRNYFGIDLTTMIVLINIASALTVLVSVPVGWVVDRVNRTRFAGFGFGLFAVFCLLTGLAPTIVLLGAFRFASGIGKTFEGPVHQPLLADSYSGRAG